MDEEEIIQTFFAPLASNHQGALGLSDDAATLQVTPGHELVVTTDALVAGIHFLPGDAPTDIAAKALGVNLSDLAGKGAEPLAYVLSLCLPQPVSATWLTGFQKGLEAAQASHGIRLIGGDTTRSPAATVLSITAFGTIPAGQMVRRSTARPGDHLYVSGTIGDAALGLLLALGDPRTEGWRLDAGSREVLLSRYRRPQPRTNLARTVRDLAHAALDISDGLVIDAIRLCRASGCTATIHAELVPLSPAAQRAQTADPQALQTVLTGGDDYELLMAVPPENGDALLRAAEQAGTPVHCIGEVTGALTESGESPVRIVAADGAQIELRHPGYTHFG